MLYFNNVNILYGFREKMNNSILLRKNMDLNMVIYEENMGDDIMEITNTHGHVVAEIYICPYNTQFYIDMCDIKCKLPRLMILDYFKNIYIIDIDTDYNHMNLLFKILSQFIIDEKIGMKYDIQYILEIRNNYISIK